MTLEAFDFGPTEVYGKVFIDFNCTGIGAKNEMTDYFR